MLAAQGVVEAGMDAVDVVDSSVIVAFEGLPDEPNGGARPFGGPEMQSSAPICKFTPHSGFHCSSFDSEIPLLAAIP